VLELSVGKKINVLDRALAFSALNLMVSTIFSIMHNVLYQEQCNLLSQIIAGQPYVFVILIVF